jgi:hypothetical protein
VVRVGQVVRAVPQGDDDIRPRLHVPRSPVSSAVAMATSTSSNARIWSTTSRRRRLPSGRRWRSSSTCRSSETSAGRLLLRDRAGQGQGHARDVRRRGIRTTPARLPFQGAVRGRALLPRRRPRRPGRPARSAADLRAVRVRRDGADPSRRPDRGMVAHLKLRQVRHTAAYRPGLRGHNATSLRGDFPKAPVH